MLRHLVDELKNVCLDKILIRQLPNVSLSWLRILSNDGRRTTPPEEKIPTRKYCH